MLSPAEGFAALRANARRAALECGGLTPLWIAAERPGGEAPTDVGTQQHGGTRRDWLSLSGLESSTPTVLCQNHVPLPPNGEAQLPGTAPRRTRSTAALLLGWLQLISLSAALRVVSPRFHSKTFLVHGHGQYSHGVYGISFRASIVFQSLLECCRHMR